MQRGRRRSERFGARQRLPTRRPASDFAIEILAVAASERVKRNVVTWPTLKRLRDSDSLVTFGRVLSPIGGGGGGGPVVGGSEKSWTGDVSLLPVVDARKPIPRAANTAQMRSRSPKPRFRSACRIALRMSRKVGFAAASRRPSVTSARA